MFFESPGALTPLALGEACALEIGGSCERLAENVYEWEQAGTGSCTASETVGCVYLISDGQDAQPGFHGGGTVNLIGADPLGESVFFTTADRLVGQDTDTQMDIYDARVGGGFPAPVTATICELDCQQSTQPAPTFGAPATEALGGAENLTPQAPAAPARPKVLTAAQKLAAALKACRGHRHARRRRVRCEARARAAYKAHHQKSS